MLQKKSITWLNIIIYTNNMKMLFIFVLTVVLLAYQTKTTE
jgi:hypothetical protein